MAIGLGAIRRQDALRVEQVLDAERDAVEGAAVLAGRNLGVGASGLLERELRGRRDDAAQLRIEALHAREVDLREPLGGQRPGLDPARLLPDRGKRDVLVVRGKRRRLAVGADEAVAGRSGGNPGDQRVPAGRGGERRLELDLARPGAPLHRRRHGALPVARDLILFRRREVDADELLRLGDRRGVHRGSHRRSGPEGRRRPGGGSRRRRGRLLLAEDVSGSGGADEARGGRGEEFPTGSRHGGVSSSSLTGSY